MTTHFTSCLGLMCMVVLLLANYYNGLIDSLLLRSRCLNWNDWAEVVSLQVSVVIRGGINILRDIPAVHSDDDMRDALDSLDRDSIA